VRCLLRDVTQQKQREHRLALQLIVSQIVGEHISAEVAATRILEALCVSQAGMWPSSGSLTPTAPSRILHRLGSTRPPSESLIQESMGLSLPSGADLPGRAWKDGRPVWIADLASVPPSPRIQSALRQEMASGWAVPIRVGNSVIGSRILLPLQTSRRPRSDGRR